MLKKLGLPFLAMMGMLAFATPKPADARVHFGVAIGAPPAYPYYCSAYDPYCSPYTYSPYAYSPYVYNYPYAYGYSYPEPYIYGGWGHGGHEWHEHHEFREHHGGGGERHHR